MNIFILNAHWCNRGDEAANRALVDEIHRLCSEANITLQFAMESSDGLDVLIYSGVKVLVHRFPHSRNLIEFLLMYISKGYIYLSDEGNDFLNTMKKADIVVHAPGGPSIGDIYSQAEFAYLCRLLLAIRLKKPVFIYAPSMGPFKSKSRNILRKYILRRACCITFRESISAGYFHELLPQKEYTVTLDSAFQNDINIEKNRKLLETDIVLCDFLSKYDKIIGFTITDLQWNPKYTGNSNLKENINRTFKKFIEFLSVKGYGIVFIPQLFGALNDRNYMNEFTSSNTFLLSDKYDCYFQQYLISQLYAVVGMRYHSNIFSCKMGTPFISISYEQKMKGFMREQKLDDYCIDILDLNYNLLTKKFESLVSEYEKYQKILVERKAWLKDKSGETTRLLFKYLEEK